MAEHQCKLGRQGPDLFIPYPRNKAIARGQGREESESFLVSQSPGFFTPDEMELASAYMAKLPYMQTLESLGVSTIGADPLLKLSHEELSALEEKLSLPSTSADTTGAARSSTEERVLLIREAGFAGDATPAGFTRMKTVATLPTNGGNGKNGQEKAETKPDSKAAEPVPAK